MRTRVVVIGLALVVVVGAVTWFWLLASVPRTEAVDVTLRVEQPPVMVKGEGESAFREAEDGMVLDAGDTVRTGESGRAVIRFFGLAESRMDGGTEVVVRQASQSAVETDSLNVQLQLSAGRVWSRVLRLFDLESAFSVETPAVVATVRGTAFDVAFGADGVTRVWVADSAVGVLPVSAQDRPAALRELQAIREAAMDATSTSALASVTGVALGALPAGEMAQYNRQGAPILHRPLSAEDRDTAWFKENTAQDQAFVSLTVAARRAELARLGGARPDQLLAGITALSERAHLLFAGEERTEEQLEQYLVRRIARLLDLVDDGKTGLASQEFARLENDIRTQIRGEDGEMVRKRARAALVRTARLLEHADPLSPQYPFKQRMEDLLVALQEGDMAAELFLRLVAVDARIDEASRLLDTDELETARVALDAARGGTSNVSRDAEPVLPTIGAERQEALIGKILALIAREAAERGRLEAILDARLQASIVPAATSTPSTPQLLAPNSQPPTPIPPVIVTPTPEFMSIRLAVGIGTLAVGSPAAIGVIADRADGSNLDVSAKSTFRIIRGNGTLNGLQFTPNVAGTAILEASYNDNGQIHITQIVVTSAGAAVLQSLTVQAASTDIKHGETTVLSAVATYSDGSTAAVTSAVSWSFSPSANGRLAGNVFTGINAATTASVPAAVTVQGLYTENGVTHIGTVGITVR